MWYLCVRRGSTYFEVVSDWLTLVADLCGTILVDRHLWTQSDDVVVLAVEFLAVVFFALLLVVLVSKYLATGRIFH